ncbi:hypothetical protein DB88DRAFT_74793 [Papiliotrema laurentii]|uniref:Uncharacterized protein n=1 Tax=Papiliotrema laurentii TaxID=5418 RepID=A0AAD9CW83_PAPLA|nr:hypothetical protein DB88DRAFT_74793 [Papiliotrema laurentii]
MSTKSSHAGHQQPPQQQQLHTKSEPCVLTALTQFECSVPGGRLVCWPIERVFRKCGNGPAIEVTNVLVPSSKTEPVPRVEQSFIDNPPKGHKWSDLR